ncbi:MAG: aminoglycoside phosphotransferase family protein [Actinomycetota bacterium]|nr:aminoglycoside phosphotransferase family protein [Actinomycetota bacterium]
MIATREDIGWQDLLPLGRTFVALPSAHRPLIVAEREAAVLEYVRITMLAKPPGSRLPAWAYELARHALRLPGLWAIAPHVRGSASAGLRNGEVGLASWLIRTGHRLVVLDHSRDPDRRIVALLFPSGSAEPSIAVKVATGHAAMLRIDIERERLRLLAGLHLAKEVCDTVPRLVELRADVPGVAMFAQPGVPMFVSFHRGGHMHDRAAVCADFTAAGGWLAALQSAPAGAAAPLDVDPSIFVAAEVQLAGAPEQLRTVQLALLVLRRRLQAHRAVQTLVHGDFWAGNILMSDGKVSGVVDWERAEACGSPVRDLGRFAAAHSLCMDRHSTPARRKERHSKLVAGPTSPGARWAIAGDGWYPQVVREYLTAGLRRLGLPPSLGLDVLLVELAAIAAEATDRQFGLDVWHTFTQLCGGNP